MALPSEDVQREIESLFNNIMSVDLQLEANAIIARISREFWPWMAHYFVTEHASKKLYFHACYSEFFDVLNDAEFTKMVLGETVWHIKMLLRSATYKTDQSNFDLLKNLGSWLGLLTLAKSRPILEADLDLKALLAEAYTKGELELQYVVPFVVRVMASCAKSQAFQPINPWTNSIIGILSELYNESNTRFNLRIEIELLCWKLNTNITEFTPSTFLKEERKKGVKEYLLSPQSPHQQ